MKKNIVLISHYSGSPGGPVDKLYEFLIRSYSILNIKHPLFPNSEIKSTMQFNNQIIEFKISSAFQYTFEGLITLFYWKRYFNKINNIDLVICFDSLSFTQLQLIKGFIKIKKVIFYNCDYSKERFANYFLNSIYQLANYFSYQKCDYFFSLSARFIHDIDPQNKNEEKNYVISGFVDLNEIKRKKRVLKNSLVYAGVLDYGSVNFTPFLNALKKLKESKINFCLDIYGKEDSKSELRKKIEQMGLSARTTFKGSLQNKILVQEILPKYQIGVAPYVLKSDQSAPDHAFLGTDLTAKLVDYIAAGLPVITSELNDGFKVIEKYKFGFLVNNEKEWFEKIKTLLGSKRIREAYGRNALRYAKKYDISTIINPILKKILSR